MMRGELVVVILFAVALALVGGFLAIGLVFPELLPWYSEPSRRSSPPVSTFWEETVA
jgi:ABC-type Fe3+-siderophore transport system permease subunit